MGKRALFLVREVSGIAALGQRLRTEHGFELLANEAAGREFASKGLPFQEVEERAALHELDDAASGISLLVANFVDVESAGRSFLSWKSALKAFDRDIVAAIRAGAWAAERVTVLGNPEDYDAFLEVLEQGRGKVPQAFRMERATAALRAASEFDFAVAQYLEIQGADAPDMGALSGYPRALRFAWPRARALDTGENPHQRAGLYGSFFEHFEQVSGADLDYVSALTVSRAGYLIGEFEKPAAALLRQGRVIDARCGEALDELVAGLLANEAAAGAWLVVNGGLGGAALRGAYAAGLAGLLAPDLSAEQRLHLVGRGEAARVLVSKSGLGYEALQEVRSVVGGALVQDKDRFAVNPMEWTVASLAQPLMEDWESLLFAAKLARHADSSACIVARGERAVAIEAGRYAAAKAWDGVEESGIGLANTVAVFDEPELEPKVLAKMKELGVRSVLLPFGKLESEQRAAANEAGLVLLTMLRSMRRL